MKESPSISSWQHRSLLPLIFATLALNTLQEHAVANNPSLPKKDAASASANTPDPAHFVVKEMIEKIKSSSSVPRFENNRVYFDLPENKNVNITLQAYIYVLLEDGLKKLWAELDKWQFTEEGFYDKWAHNFLSKAQENWNNMLPGIDKITVTVQETGIVEGGDLQVNNLWADAEYIWTTSYRVTITIPANGQLIPISMYITSRKEIK